MRGASSHKTLYQGDHYSVVTLSEDGNPVVVLDSTFLNNLGYVLRAAYSRALTIAPGQDVEAIRDLCERLRPILRRYDQACFEWAASRPLSPELAEVKKDLDKLRKMLDDWDPNGPRDA